MNTLRITSLFYNGIYEYHKFLNLPSHTHHTPIIYYEDQYMHIRQFLPSDQHACLKLFINGMLDLRIPALYAALRTCQRSIYGYLLSFLLFITHTIWSTYLPHSIHAYRFLIIMLPTLLLSTISLKQGWYWLSSHIEYSFNDDMSDIYHYYHSAQSDACFLVAIAKSCNQIAGIVALDNHSGRVRNDMRYGAELRRMSVSTKYRNMGIGKKLLNAFEKYACEHHYTRMCLGTSSVQPDAIHLYTKHGRWVTVDTTYDPSGIAWYTMEKLTALGLENEGSGERAARVSSG